MRIGPVDSAERVAVVAEIGNNHEGDMGVARELVEAAAAAGAHAVKFQAIDPAELVHPGERERIAQLERFRLSDEQFAQLAALARERGVGFLCTPFSPAAVEWLAPLVDALKIASGDNDHLPLIERAAATGRPLIVSAGMTGVDGLRRALDCARGASTTEPAVLHCVSAYPVDPAAARLSTIPVLARELGREVGYSDHTLGIEACVAATALGARILEKHFTLDHHHSAFRDHQLSAEPAEMSELVRRVAEVEVLLGEPRDREDVLRRVAEIGVLRGEPRDRDVLPEEEAVAAAARRSAVAARDLPAGHDLVAGDVRFLRPAGPIGPSEPLLGRRLRRAVPAGRRLEHDDLL